jgi:hypothetical protein
MNEFTTTPNLHLKKPFYNADAEQWGYHLNQNSDRLDSLMGDASNVIIEGADPGGVLDSTEAFRAALATGKNVFVPRGTYLITGQLHLATENGPQTLFGEGHSSILLIDPRFDPTVTTGVILITGIHDKADARGQVSNLIIKFVQPTDIITTATVAVAAGNSSVIVASAAGIKVGMSVVDITHWVIPTVCLFTEDIPALVTSVSGNTITFDKVIVNEGIFAGDSIHFASVRSMFKTLANGGTAGPGGTGIKYPWAIYNTTGESTTLRDLMIINAWDGIWLRGSSFTIEKVDCGAFDIGLDIDDCYNFPTVNNFRFWPWGYFSATVPHERTAFSATYYDGTTVCANFGETDGVGIYNLQSWTGIVNLTARWSWGEFINLMLDGNNASLNIVAAGGGFVQITSGYSSKGHTLTTPIYINTPIGFHSHFVNFDLGNASPFNNGMVIDGGTVTFGDSSMWDGLQSSREFIQVNNASVLTLRNMLLNAGGGGVNAYIKLTGTATLHMSDTRMVRDVTGLTDAFYYVVSGTATTPVYLDNIFWNGWKVNLPGGIGNSINVLDYGADPTGTYDSSYAINLAAGVVGPNGRHKAVYLPTGTYRVNHQINLTASQGMYGDARGASILYVDDKFDPTAEAVIMCNAAFFDAGPVLRDFGITFAQPQDQTSRANFKTLAAGGTSSPGGTGVKYPWAISSNSQSYRIQCIRLRIGGAWDGITTNALNVVYWLEDIEMGALDCGVNMGDGIGVQDFAHIHQYHFWTFEMGSGLQNVYYDGQTISLRVGRSDGLNITGYCCFVGRTIFTGDGGYTGCHIANAMFDGGQATLEILGTGIGHLWISNSYASAGTTERLRPFLTMSGPGHLKIDNFYSHSSAAYPDFLITNAGADVTLSNFHCNYYTSDHNWVTLQAGTMWIHDGQIAIPGARTVPAIAETGSGILVIDNVQFNDAGTGGTGVVFSMVSANTMSMIGALSFSSTANWTVSLPNNLQTTYFSPRTSFNGGAVFVGSIFANGLVQVGTLGGGSAGTVAVFGQAGEQKALLFYRGTQLAWTFLSQGAGDDYNIGRWDDGGVFRGNPFSINRLTGVVTAPLLAGPVMLASVPTDTSAQLALSPSTPVNASESKLRFHGTFPTGGDTSNYLAATLRGGWNATAWDGSYLNVWVTNTGNGNSSDASMRQVASFTPTGFQVGTLASPDARITLFAPAGAFKGLYMARGNTGSAWVVGSRDATDDFAVLRFDDLGGFKANSLLINRATGQATFEIGVTVGSPTVAGTISVLGPVGVQKQIYLSRGTLPAWGLFSRDATDDFAIARFDDSGGFRENTLLINRATGRATFAFSVGFNGTAAIAKPTGYTAPTGTATRATFATGSVTLPVLAEHVKALIDDLTATGLIGP